MKKLNTPDSAVFQTGNEIQIGTFRVLLESGKLVDDSTQPNLSQEESLNIYKAMVTTRILDERMLAAQRQGRISFYMQSTGEEAASVGAAAALDDSDMIMAQYREQGALIYRGFGIDKMMNQLLGNSEDIAKGRQLPVHYGSSEFNYMTISSPLATQIPQAAGFAYGQKLEGKKKCTLCFFGEGAASEGDFHAGMNMAAVHETPVIFFCRNNGYAISTPSSEQFSSDGIAPRAFGYGMHVLRVDGNDIIAVLLATRKARHIAVENNVPVLIEAMTYRVAPHSSSDDPSSYRLAEEEESWREKDPILRMQRWLINLGWWSQDEEESFQESQRRKILETFKFVEKHSPPSLDSLITNVYKNVTPALDRQLSRLKDHILKYPEFYPKGATSLDPGVNVRDVDSLGAK